MTKAQNKVLIALFCIGLTLLLVLGLYLHIPYALFQFLFLAMLMLLFYFNQEPLVMGVCGAAGLVYVCTVGFMGFDFHSPGNYLLYAIETLLDSGVYFLTLHFCIWLKKLKNISNLHELVISGTTAGLWKWKDVNSDIQWWSPRYYRLLGYDNDEIPATITNLKELIHPDDRAIAFQAMQDYMDGKRTDMECEYRMRTKSGDYKWFLGSGEVQFEPGTRRPVRVVGSIVNIDHKKQYELALAKQASLLALFPTSVITTDPDQIVTSWNEAAEKLYDIKSEKATGKNIRSLFTTSYPYATEEEVLRQYQENGIWRGEANQVTAQGQKVYVLSLIKMITDIKGRNKGMLIVSSDLSLLRTNKELSSALKMVENSTQYLEQLAYVSSQDLRSPIVTLQGLVNHLAASKAIKPGFEATFEMIRELVEQMKSTSVSLSSILQLRKNLISREFATEKVSVAQVLKDVQDMLKLAIENSAAQINVNVEKGLMIRVHHTFLKAILFNLVSNSIKFKHPDRSPVIDIKAETQNDMVSLTVSDNGSGINMSRYRNKLFTIFTRFHDDVEGNGIGLHSVKMIVDFHKGNIDIDSEEGKGTSITIKLPLEPDGEN